MADLKDIPFDDYVRFVLNSGYYFDNFEIGSVKIDPVCWPTTPRKKPYDPSKFEGSTSLKNKSTDQVQKIENNKSVVPLVKVPNKMISAPNVPTMAVPNHMISAPNQTVTPMIAKEEEKDVNVKVKMMINKVSVSKSPQGLHSKQQSKLECTKRKLRQQYDQIENERKRRRIQIIDLPPPVEMQTKQRRRADQMFKSTTTRKLHLTNSIY